MKKEKPKERKTEKKIPEKEVKPKIEKTEKIKKIKKKPMILKEVTTKIEKPEEIKVELKPFELIREVEPEVKKEVKPKVREIRKIAYPRKIKKPIKKRSKVLKKEEVKPEKKIGGGSFIASGILGILVPAMFYIVLGDFNSFLQNCSLPFSTIDIGDEMIVNCTEIRFVYVLSLLCMFFGSIFILWGIAKKIIGMKKSFEKT